MLCEVCVGALEHRKGWLASEQDPADAERHVFLAHHQSIASLEASADAACEICHPLWAQYDDATQRLLVQHDISVQKRWHPDGPRVYEAGEKFDEFEGLVTILVVLYYEKPIMPGIDEKLMGLLQCTSEFLEGAPRQLQALPHCMFTFQPVATTAADPSHVPKIPFHGTSTDCAESWRTAERWLDECLRSHGACNNNPDGESWYPTRLLDLGDADAHLDTIRVVVTAEDCREGVDRYTTLSHCWGSAQFLQLNKANLAELRDGFELHDLPKTFRDAVAISQRMGVRYLWIDSLCILQDRDDLSDWLVEAERMHKVYSHSFCNISAAAASDSSGGLFFPRKPELSDTAVVKVCVTNFGMGSDHIDYQVVNYLFWPNNVGDAPLNKRAWVLQERFLAPRVLHFGRDQLFWECRERDAAEYYPEGLPRLMNYSVVTNFKSLDPELFYGKMAHPGRPRQDMAFAFYQRWDNIVRKYSETSLTKGQDKLIALSGLAKKMRSLINDNYVAGMWEKHLAAELLWAVDDTLQADGMPSFRPTTYRAPTWSWASVDGKINYGDPKKTNLIMKVVDWHLIHATDDDTSLVTGGHLDLRGKLRAFQMVVKPIGDLNLLLIKVNGVIVKAKTKTAEWQFGPLVQLDVPQNDFDDDNAAGRLFYIQGCEPPDDDDFAVYLLLRVVDPGQGIFERFALAQASNSEEQVLLAADQEGQDEFPCREYREGLHTIRIV